MELGLSLGNRRVENGSNNNDSTDKMRGFCMGLGRSMADIKSSGDQEVVEDDDMNSDRREKVSSSSSPEDPSPSQAAPPPPRLQLDLLPFSPVPRTAHPPPPLRFPWLQDNLSSEPGSSDGAGTGSRAAVEMNRRRTADEAEEQSSPNSGTSSLMEFSLYTSTTNSGGSGVKGTRREREEGGDGKEVIMMGLGGERERERGSDDDDENGLGSSSTRKKLRLSKEQSAFLEESFKEHHTLNPKQKLALAKQLNLRPRQVEVWFQNRRARTKLKQTEVDCEYLKRCCETLTEDNRRLQKELQELRALKTSQPFFMHLPPTTLTMCPSCERVAPTSTSTSTSTSAPAPAPATALSLGKPKPKTMLPFSDNVTSQAHQAANS